MCLSATTTPEATTGRTALPPALVSYRPSWPMVRLKVNKCEVDPRFSIQVVSSPLGTRVSDPSGHVGGERAPLPPPVVLHASQWVADPLAAAACLGPGSGNLSAGYRAPAGSICGGRNIKSQKFNLLKSNSTEPLLGFFFCRCGVYGRMLNISPVTRRQKIKRASEQQNI